MATVNKETGEILDDTEAEADAAENEHERPAGWIAPTVDEPREDFGVTEDAADEPAPAANVPTEKQLEKMGKDIDKASTTHENALRRILGDQFAEWMPCPLCMTDGHIQPMPAEARDPAQVQAVHAALGEDGYSELREAPDLDLCTVCDGHGKVRTPSKSADPGNRAVNCTNCASRGYVNRPLPPVAAVPQWTPPTPTPTANAWQAIPGGSPDNWGRPAGHPHWGLDPAGVV